MKDAAGSSAWFVGRGPAGPFRAALVAWLAVYLAFGGQIDGQLWARGGHATPEQWATHARLQGLGVSRHHSRTEGPSSDAQADASVEQGLVAAALSVGLSPVEPLPTAGASSGHPVHQLRPSASSSVNRAGPPEYPVRHADTLARGALPAPPETPPPIVH